MFVYLRSGIIDYIVTRNRICYSTMRFTVSRSTQSTMSIPQECNMIEIVITTGMRRIGFYQIVLMVTRQIDPIHQFFYGSHRTVENEIKHSHTISQSAEKECE